MLRIVLGLLKGGIVGAALGYLASRAGISGGVLGLLVQGAVGAAVGVICGKPIWRQETIWTPVLKALFGFGVGLGLAFLARKVLGGVHIPVAAIPGSSELPLPSVPALLGPLVGAAYGLFVEVDDGGGAAPKGAAPAAK